MKSIQKRMNKGCLFPTCYSKESAAIPLHLAETQRQAEEWENFIVGKRKSFRCALTEVGGMGKLEAGYQEAGHPM